MGLNHPYSSANTNRFISHVTIQIFFKSIPFKVLCNLVPRASFPLTNGRKTRALGATISGMRHRCRCAVSRTTRIRLFPLLFQNGCSQSSRFLPQARRIVGSGDEIGCCGALPHLASTAICRAARQGVVFRLFCLKHGAYLKFWSS